MHGIVAQSTSNKFVAYPVINSWCWIFYTTIGLESTQTRVYSHTPRGEIHCFSSTHGCSTSCWGQICNHWSDSIPYWKRYCISIGSPNIDLHLLLEKPELIQVTCFSVNPVDGQYQVNPLVQPFFADESIEDLVIYRGLNGNLRRCPIHLWFSKTALENKSPINHSIQHMTQNMADTAWHGRAIALRFSGSRMKGYVHASAIDLVDISDYLISYKHS